MDYTNSLMFMIADIVTEAHVVVNVRNRIHYGFNVYDCGHNINSARPFSGLFFKAEFLPGRRLPASSSDASPIEALSLGGTAIGPRS